MAMILLIVGVCLVISSYIFKPPIKIEADTSTSIAFPESFNEQFKQSRQQLQVNQDLSELRIKLDQLEQQLAELQNTVVSLAEQNITQRLDQLQEGVQQLLQNEKAANISQSESQHEIVQDPKQTFIEAQTSEKIASYLKLKAQGQSLDEIVKLLQMEKGEVLFLENLSKSITNS